MRLAFFGGSFDPPHRGHLAIAQAAAHHLSLDRVLLAPTGRQPFKRTGAEADFADRLAMVDLLCTADPARLASSSLDAPHHDGSPNYTIDALKALHRQRPAADLFAIVGADSLLDLPNWHAGSRLFEEATWIAVSRPNHPLPTLLPPALDVAQRKGRLHLIPDIQVPASSTDLRGRLHRDEDCSDALPEPVLAYIRTHSLYT